jgi:hypothetical protein
LQCTGVTMRWVGALRVGLESWCLRECPPWEPREGC